MPQIMQKNLHFLPGSGLPCQEARSVSASVEEELQCQSRAGDVVIIEKDSEGMKKVRAIASIESLHESRVRFLLCAFRKDRDPCPGRTRFQVFGMEMEYDARP